MRIEFVCPNKTCRARFAVDDDPWRAGKPYDCPNCCSEALPAVAGNPPGSQPTAANSKTEKQAA